jgi:hydrogenase expression/formation protein HypD
MAGLRSALPPQIGLIAGPGCPVCVCPEEDLHAAIRLALRPEVILIAFGDLLRVPANLPKRVPRSLEQARAAGADVRPIASPGEALRIARTHPDREVVFFAAGFETTMAPVAALIAQVAEQGGPANLSILLAGRLTAPAVQMLLDGEAPGFDALIAPGHVATVMGPEEWSFLPAQRGMPCALAGFEPASLLAALYSVLRQHVEGRPFLDNCYGSVVKPGGNPTAQRLLSQTMDVVDANWRGIGVIPRSGLVLKPSLGRHDATLRFPLEFGALRKHAGDMPPGCDCARVVLGRIRPVDCVLYGGACTPRNPVGPCMVSDEGACRIAWASGLRRPARSAVTVTR